MQVRRLYHSLQRSHMKYIFLGAMTMMVVMNGVIHVGVGLSYICEEECTLHLLAGRVSNFHRDLVGYVRLNYLDPPAPKGSFKPAFDITNPPWSKLGAWGNVHKEMQEYFSNYKVPGQFVEVGAQDGEFMSFTLFLERLNFTGLLIEPNPRDYKILREKKRSAYSINACAHPFGYVTKENIWIRHFSGHLPPLLERVQKGSNRLSRYVAKEDVSLGNSFPVQCFSLETIVQAAFGNTMIDMLTVSTHGGEIDMLTTLSDNVKIRVLIVLTSIGGLDGSDVIMEEFAAKKGLTRIKSNSNIHVYLPKQEVSIRNVKE